MAEVDDLSSDDAGRGCILTDGDESDVFCDILLTQHTDNHTFDITNEASDDGEGSHGRDPVLLSSAQPV
mgnify:CR=1 FL=1